MIKIEKPYIVEDGEKTRCICDIYIKKQKKEIWFEVEKKYGKYLCDDRVDAYLIGILNYAMRENLNIKCEAPVTEDLLYNIETTLIPSLSKYGRNLSSIKIEAKTVTPIKEGTAVGTGCSCGIDSFAAIYNHIDSKYKNFDLTHLCINNVGAFNECYSEYGIQKAKEERYFIAERVAKELGIELIKTDSNFGEAIPQNHYLTNTYSGCFAIYMLQKLWRVYYLASVGLDYSKFTIIDNDNDDSAHYDLLTLQCFSNAGLKIYSEGGEKSRVDKTKDIVDFEIAQKYLHVCIHKSTNCGICTKCRRTILSLDYLNKLDNFSNVFDIDYYHKNKKDYYRWLYKMHINNDLMNEPVYQGLKKRKDFQRAIRLYKYVELLKKSIKKFLKKILPPKIINVLKKK